MIELELFFKIVESEIRHKHIKYLKKQKCRSAAEQPSPAGETETTVDDFPADKKLKYAKRFNQGIDAALKVLQSEFTAFSNRMEEKKEKGRKL